jgi:GT2 family glycosyltransferase
VVNQVWSRPLFSVVIPTYRRPGSLSRVLDALAAQASPTPPFEVVVVCDGESDPAAGLIRTRSWPLDLKLVQQPRQGPAAARNRGIGLARGEYLLFLDDDVIPVRDFISRHAAAHDGDQMKVVIGPLLPTRERRPPWITWEFETLRRQYEAMESGAWQPSWRQFHTGNASVSRENVNKFGGFDPSFTRAEDVELGLRLGRAGLTFHFCYAAAATHVADRNFAAWLSVGYNYGVADVVITRLHDDVGILSAQAREFRGRHPYTRRLVTWSLSHRRPVGVLTRAAKIMVRALAVAGRRDLAHSVCGAIFNLLYWCGVSDAVGDRSLVTSSLEDDGSISLLNIGARAPGAVRPAL